MKRLFQLAVLTTITGFSATVAFVRSASAAPSTAMYDCSNSGCYEGDSACSFYKGYTCSLTSHGCAGNTKCKMY